MERVEIYGWTVQDHAGWRAVAVAVRTARHHRNKKLERAAATAEEALEALANLTAALATLCRRRGKKVTFRMLKSPPPGL